MQRHAWTALGVLAAATLATAFQNPPRDGHAAPRFEDFPVAAAEMFHGAPAAPQLKTAGQRTFRTMIRDGASKGPAFAGHYSVPQWGCGAGCLQMALIDARSGAVYDGPFGTLPNATLAPDPNVDPDKSGIFFHLDSFLLLARGCPNEKDCGTYYYRWTGARFELLRRIPSPPQP